jgi:hypothetical protein
VGKASQAAVLATQFVESQFQVQTSGNVTPGGVTHGPPIASPNSILQDDNNDKPTHWYKTRSWMTSIMQEAMLACISITKPMFKISVAKLSTQKFTLIWFCNMANSVLGKKGELLEYQS